MDRARLEQYLDAGMSLIQIGVLTNRDPSTVGYWVKKHGLVANGQAKYAPRGRLSREELEPLVEAGMTVSQIADVVDRSCPTVRYWLSKFGLKTRSRRGPKPMVDPVRVEEALAAGQTTLIGNCRYHGETVFLIENGGRVRCRRCRMQRVSQRRRDVKAILIKEAGGRCVRCGYDRCLGALHFHHRDRTKKAFGISRKGVTIGIDKLREEAQKCVVLCANCHAEVEHGGAVLTLK